MELQFRSNRNLPFLLEKYKARHDPFSVRKSIFMKRFEAVGSGADSDVGFGSGFEAALDAAFEAALDAAFEAAFGAAFEAAFGVAFEAAFGVAFGAAFSPPSLSGLGSRLVGFSGLEPASDLASDLVSDLASDEAIDGDSGRALSDARPRLPRLSSRED